MLAEALAVSRGVVSEAYAQIAAEGWIEIRRGAAPVVRAVPPPPAVGAPDGRPANGWSTRRVVDAAQARSADRALPRLDLTATAPDLSAFPRRAWSAALRRVLAEMPDAALDYGDPRGDDGAAAPSSPRTWCGCAGVAAAPDARWSRAATRRGCG